MKKINYELIISDFDGTLITDEQKILPEVKEAIDEYISRGGIFAVCTGRMLKSILPRVRSLGLKGIVVAYQGTVIAEIESGKILKNGGMNCDDVYGICRVIEELDNNINVYSGNNLYTDLPSDNQYLIKYEKITGVSATSVEGKISDFVKKNKLFCEKVACLVSPENREKLYSDLKSRLDGKFDVTCSASVLVEISPLNDNKGEALKFLADYYSVPYSKTVAIGDNLNDIPMIKAAGLGCAVGNAPSTVKEVADYISATNNDGAVAQIIKKFGLA